MIVRSQFNRWRAEEQKKGASGQGKEGEFALRCCSETNRSGSGEMKRVQSKRRKGERGAKGEKAARAKGRNSKKRPVSPFFPLFLFASQSRTHPPLYSLLLPLPCLPMDAQASSTFWAQVFSVRAWQTQKAIFTFQKLWRPLLPLPSLSADLSPPFRISPGW